MLPYGFADLADSPTIILSPHQHQFDPISSRAAHSYCLPSHKPIMPFKPWDCRPMAPAPVNSGHSKKRSHDETDSDEEPVRKPNLPAPTPRISPDEVHGRGIPLKDPMTGCEKPRETVPGVSMQEKLVEENRPVVEQKVAQALRPSVEREDSTFKRQRQCSTDSVVSQGAPVGQAPMPVLTSYLTHSSDFTQLMGIGWTAISQDADTVSAWRGIGKGIEKTVGIVDVIIVAKNENLNACVVEAKDGWYLVSTCVNWSRFLATGGQDAFRKLRENPSLMKEIADAQSGLHPAQDCTLPSQTPQAVDSSLSGPHQSADAGDHMDVD